MKRKNTSPTFRVTMPDLTPQNVSFRVTKKPDLTPHVRILVAADDFERALDILRAAKIPYDVGEK